MELFWVFLPFGNNCELFGQKKILPFNRLKRSNGKKMRKIISFVKYFFGFFFINYNGENPCGGGRGGGDHPENTRQGRKPHQGTPFMR